MENTLQQLQTIRRRWARLLFEQALKIAKGETVEANVDCGTVLVNKDNANDYYDDSIMFVHQAD